MRRDRGRLRGLYAVTPECSDTARLVAMVQACIAGGAALVQYRAKQASGSLALVQGRALAGICAAAAVPLVVNDSVELAAAIGADGVHLGRDDVSVREARIALPDVLIGVSCYADAERARAAGRDGADYVGVGAMYASATKPGAAPAPLEAIARARAASGLPVAAIGGVTLDNGAALVAAGADMLAVISALFDAADTSLAATRFAQLIDPQPGATSDARTQPQPV